MSGHAAPVPSPPAPELAGRLRLVVARLARRLRQEADAGVTVSQLSALATLSRSGPVTLGELAAMEGVQPPSMTKIVAALERARLVTREADPDDRRVAWVRLSPQGERLMQRSRSRKNAFLARRLRDLSPAERATLERAAPILERLLGGAE
jgi:DNA-binding MarR family transcriptional regulator